MRARLAVLSSSPDPSIAGGAERLAHALVEALRRRGHDAQLRWIPSGESSFDAIRRSIDRASALPLDEFDGVISLKAPAFAVAHRRHVAWVLHQLRALYDLFDVHRVGDVAAAQRDWIAAADRFFLSDGRVRGRFSLSEVVRRRLLDYCGLDSRALHPGPVRPTGRAAGSSHFLAVSRLVWHKGLGRLVEAYRSVATNLPLVVVGDGPDRLDLERAACSDARIRLVGAVGDAELARLYATARAVVFVPRDEDFGYVALEGLGWGKPVVTCADSGGPLEIVTDGVDSIVCEATPRSLAAGLARFAADPALAARMGAAGRRNTRRFAWSHVVSAIERSLDLPRPSTRPSGRGAGVPTEMSADPRLVGVATLLSVREAPPAYLAAITETALAGAGAIEVRVPPAHAGRSRFVRDAAFLLRSPRRRPYWIVHRPEWFHGDEVHHVPFHRVLLWAAHLFVARPELVTIVSVPFPYRRILSRIASRLEQRAWRGLPAVEASDSQTLELFRLLVRRRPRGDEPAPCDPSPHLTRPRARIAVLTSASGGTLDARAWLRRLDRAGKGIRWTFVSGPRSLATADLRAAVDEQEWAGRELGARLVPAWPSPRSLANLADANDALFFLDAAWARASAGLLAGHRVRRMWVGERWPFERPLPDVAWIRPSDASSVRRRHRSAVLSPSPRHRDRAS